MVAIPIELKASHNRPLGMSPARFLREYWQKQPLLVRGMFAGFQNALTPEDLAGLACEEAALSRIVLHDPGHNRWTLRTGPFGESDFATLPKTHWTLLVQDVDKWDADVAALLDGFGFIPAWRRDDVMVSYATDGGGVGPHVDRYDVFLVQGIGRRRWRISTDPGAPMDFRADSDLKLLAGFAPTHDWVLEPGDALYLPPGVPHEGKALGECMTFSIGMRAPSRAELLLDFAEFLAEPLGEEKRYADPDLRPAKDPGEIDAVALRRVRAAMPHFSNVDNSVFASWFGRFITAYRAAHEAAPAARPLSHARLGGKLAGTRLLRNPWSRMAWTRHGRNAELFVAGHSYRCTVALARLIAGQRDLDGDAVLARAGKTGLPVLAALVNAGHLLLAKRR
ncbi:MAG: cupin domain-containing protein [Rudaea sp.]|nr:cupin domain-containing protein [Rudaea sp.]